jgi:hypothetical protein
MGRGEMMNDHYDRYNGMENLLGTNLAEVGTDAISRQQAIDALRKLREEDIEDYGCEIPEGFNQDHLDRATFAIKQLPPIQPEPHWIPVTERLPEEKDAGILKKLGTSKRSEYVLATVEVKGERMTVTACTYDGEWDWNMKYAFPDYKIIAWMPLPEAYKPTVPPECEGDCGWCKPAVIEKCKEVTT